jgi:hypothetical protein
MLLDIKFSATVYFNAVETFLYLFKVINLPLLLAPQQTAIYPEKWLTGMSGDLSF